MYKEKIESVISIFELFRQNRGTSESKVLYESMVLDMASEGPSRGVSRV